MSETKNTAGASQQTAGQEGSFSIQPHPATSNDPSDLMPGGGLRSSKGAFSAFEAKQPHVISAEIANNLPPALSPEELKRRQEELNK